MNVPGSQITGLRGGIHNSVTRTVLKPTHMVGGYAQLSYGFNYYGTVGSNRDEFVIVRKLNKVDWLDHSNPRRSRRRRRPRHENPRPDRDGDEPRQMHRLPHLLGHLQERLDLAPGHGIRVVQQCRDQARHRLSQGLGEPGALARRLGAQDERQDRAEAGRPAGDPAPRSSPIRICPRSTTTTSRSPSTTSTLQTAPETADRAGRAAAVADHRQADGQDRVGAELGGDSRRRVRQALARTTISRRCRRTSTASSKTPS